MKKRKLRIIPLGGLGEIGKNMMVLEYDDDIVIIDSGLMFPKGDMLGIDIVIPDISYLEANRSKIRGIVITHGHEDHIGALPYVLSRLQVPVYASKLTHGLIQVKLKEHKSLKGARLEVVAPGEEIKLGKFRVELFSVCHSIPDAMGLIIHTPIGILIHSGDFKIDHTPVDGKPIDLTGLARWGAQGVLALLSDSTYAELPGYTPSEKVVGEALDRIVNNAPGRVIVATFASLISRIQQVIDIAVKYERRVFVSGLSMIDNIHIATELGYLHIPAGTLINFEELKKLPDDRIIIICTGTQGEPTSALVRIANGEHHQIHIVFGDTVIMSSTPIPGNESVVYATINQLYHRGARMFYGHLESVHVHGHASQEELKLLLNLIKPKFFIPIHGEYRHLILHSRLAQSIGIPASNTFVMEDGGILELTQQSGKINGKVSARNILVDGLSVGSIGQMVLKDRKALSRDGIVVVVIPVSQETGKLAGSIGIVSRGFGEESEIHDFIETGRELVARTFISANGHAQDRGEIAGKIKSTLGQYLYEQTKRHPTIMSVLIDI